MTGDRLTRWTAVAAVLAVAGVAAYVSYWHSVEVVTGHGEPGIIGHLYPVVIDGIIVAASMVLLDAARHHEDAPRLAWLLLGAGIAVTLAANVAYGAGYGVAGALWAAWPAAAFVGCYELLLMLARASARRESSTPGGQLAPVPEGVPDVPGELNGHGHAAAEMFAVDLEAGRVPGIRAIRSGLHVGQDKASQVQAYLRSITRTP
jgi:hypothetical protein